VDDCSDTDSFVAAGVGEQLHDGRVYYILMVVAVIVVIVGFIQGRGAV
jgi:hypothetical protein